MTVSVSRGMSTSTFFRLCSRAPRTERWVSMACRSSYVLKLKEATDQVNARKLEMVAKEPDSKAATRLFHARGHDGINRPMSEQTRIPWQASAAIQARVLYGLGLLIAFAAYWIAFSLTYSQGVAADALSALRNVASLALAGWAALAFLRAWVLRHRATVQLALHVPLALAFTFFWYWLLMLFIGISEGTLMEFRVEHFLPTSAATWQFLQGVTVYSLLVSLTVLREQPPARLIRAEVAAPSRREADANDVGFSRYFIRKGEEILPVETSKIISIAGAGDYSEVVTTEGHHLVRMPLGEFERALESDRFIRVHRSHIVNLHRLERGEPAGGGRLLLHMENGQILQASRAGARLLRQRVL